MLEIVHQFVDRLEWVDLVERRQGRRELTERAKVVFDGRYTPIELEVLDKLSQFWLKGKIAQVEWRIELESFQIRPG